MLHMCHSGMQRVKTPMQDQEPRSRGARADKGNVTAICLKKRCAHHH